MINRHLQTTENNEVVLMSDKGYLPCPFAHPRFEQDNLGGPPRVIQRPCDSTCPHFHFDENKSNSVTLTCGGTSVNLVIQEVKPFNSPFSIVR